MFRWSPSRQKRLMALAYGGCTLGVVNGVAGIDFASAFTSFLVSLLSLIATVLFGGNVSGLIRQLLPGLV